MMRIKYKNSKITKMLIVGLILLASLALIVFTLEKLRITNFIQDPFYKEELSATEQANKEDPTQETKEDVSSDLKSNSTKSTSDIPVSTQANLAIEYLTQTDGHITYRSVITGTVSDGGTCSITFTKDGAKPVVATSSAKDYVCTSEPIPEQQFSMIGVWHATVRYFSEDQQIIASQDMQVN